MKYRLFEKGWVSVERETPPHKQSRFDASHHIKNEVHAGYIIGKPRAAVGESGVFFGLNESGAEMTRDHAVEIGLISPEVALLNTTIYIHPGENQCNVYQLPYPMRPGQSPADLNPEYQADWRRCGLLNAQLKASWLDKHVWAIKDAVEGQMGGTYFTVDLHDFGLPLEYLCNDTGIFEYDIYRKDQDAGNRRADRYVGKIALSERGDWRVMPAVGTFDGGKYNPFHQRGFPASGASSLCEAIAIMQSSDSELSVSRGLPSLISKGVDALVNDGGGRLDAIVAESNRVLDAKDRAIETLGNHLSPKIDREDLERLNVAGVIRVVEELWGRCGVDAKEALASHPNVDIALKAKAHLVLDEEDKMEFINQPKL